MTDQSGLRDTVKQHGVRALPVPPGQGARKVKLKRLSLSGSCRALATLEDIGQ